ncbi:MAG: hypothetical protein SFX73_23145 [Kofleriaceae bacterium]|nr:hypothetical protein [Kofleriaceae bacterium]
MSAAADAFMNLARVAHPDLHRTALTPTEFDQLVLAYSRVAGAYQDLRTARPRGNTLIPPISPGPAPTPPPPSVAASASMNSKAIIYFRKAELAAKRGDLRTAILQIKMAIAADPQSAMLRTALGQVEAELAKSKA